jgi:hypothetical protein
VTARALAVLHAAIYDAWAAYDLTAFTGRGNFEMTVTIPAGKSRQYGGIHFEDGDNHAREAGAAVGKQAWAKALTYFNGTAP